MRNYPVLLAIFWLGLVTVTAPAVAVEITPTHGQPGEFGISLGAEYTTGKYGSTESTDVQYYPLTLQYETGRWLWWARIPYLVMEGPGDVVIIGSGMGGRRSATTTTTRRSESGPGDIITAASYRLLQQTENRPALDLAGKVYFGTADETRGLGSGENNYAAQLGLMKDVGAWSTTGTVGYLITGDPAGTVYEDVFYGAVDVARNFDRHSLGAILEAQQETLASAGAPARITGYLTVRPGSRTELTAYLLHGLTDAAPDRGVGVTILRRY